MMTLAENMNIDLIPVKLFCQLYDKVPQTIYSWRRRYPEIIGIVVFEPPKLEMHVSIRGYEQWIRGELSNSQQEQGQKAQASSLCLSGLKAPKRGALKPLTGAIPQLT